MSSNQHFYLTVEGVENLRKELDYLINVRRPALAERLRHAIQQGDLAENADYTAAKEEQGFLEGRIQQIEAMLRSFIIIEESAPTGAVSIGNRVTVVEAGDDGEAEPESFRIVGPAEANPAQGNISYESPLGQALLGRQVGETVVVAAPAGNISFKILAIH